MIKKNNLGFSGNLFVYQDKNMFSYGDKKLTKQEEVDKIRQEELLNIWKNSDCIF